MAEKRKKLVEMTSPRGVFIYPKVTAPDYGNEKFPKPDGEYQLRLRVQQDDPITENFIKQLKVHFNEARELAVAGVAAMKVGARKKLQEKHGEDGFFFNDLFAVVYDKDTEEETGEIEFKFSMKASGTRKDGKKWSAKPALFDAAGRPIKKAIEIWGGTEGKVAFKISPYFIPGTGAAGIKLMLTGVQVIDLVQGGERSAASMGFGAEDGYSYDPEDHADEDEGADQDGGSTDGDDTDADGEDDF